LKRLLLAMMVLGSSHVLAGQAETSKPKPPFQPAQTLSVTEIALPISCAVSYGFVVLDVVVTETGKVEGIEVRRDIPCLTPLAVQAVEKWKFSPATFAGEPIASRVPVAVTFRPPSMLVSQVTLPKLKPKTDAAIQAEFQPAEVLRGVFPGRGATVVSVGTAVLEVTLSEKGEAEEVKVIRDLPNLAAEAKSVVGDWRFMPATFNGTPVRSKIVLAFVSQPIVVTR